MCLSKKLNLIKTIKFLFLSKKEKVYRHNEFEKKKNFTSHWYDRLLMENISGGSKQKLIKTY